MLILPDSSAWVEYLRGTGSTAHHKVRDLIEGSDIATTDPVVMEIVSGARTDGEESDLRGLLARCALLPFETPTDFDGAASIYRSCRRSGITVRGTVDCMIATVAMRHGATLLAWDKDLARIAGHIGIELDLASKKVDA